MEFKKTDKHKTPNSEISILGRRISQRVNCTDSPFRNFPNVSTPPSRFTRIMNPFESQLIESMHLPTFSPNVFVQNSTPKNQNFKWTIDDISSLKPADIDETTVSQYASTTHDPHIESLMQQKIATFFNETEIVPSPMNVKVNNAPLINVSRLDDTPPRPKETCEGSTQTMLSLPPILPKELEEALKPYFNHAEDSVDASMKNSSLYKQLFDFDQNACEAQSRVRDSVESTPVLSSFLSPVQLSPYNKNLPELKDCTLSPINKNTSGSRLSKSACRLNFSDHRMSLDASLIVPDLDEKPMCSQSSFSETDLGMRLTRNGNMTINETVNWSMEYKQISIDSSSSSSSSTNSDQMDMSNSNTPHSKIFTGKGQRKRLSESFKEQEDKENNANNAEFNIKNRTKLFKNDTDLGYCTQETTDFGDNACNLVFASTPSKRQNQVAL